MTTEAEPRPVRRGPRGARPGDGARGARRAQHRHEDVLRLPDRVRCRAQHPGLPRLPRPARRPAGGQREGRRVGHPDRPRAELRDRAWCRFARKNYFYPDMPKNFQTSQYDEPIAFEGCSTSSSRTAPSTGSRSSAPTWRRTPASRCTSAAPPAHPRRRPLAWSTTTGRHPAHRDRHQADDGGGGAGAGDRPRLRLRAARPAQGARRLGRADGAGLAALRRQPVAAAARDDETLGTRSETKNVNSLRSVERAVRYEIRRQAAILTSGGAIVQETRHWHEDTGVPVHGSSPVCALGLQALRSAEGGRDFRSACCWLFRSIERPPASEYPEVRRCPRSVCKEHRHFALLEHVDGDPAEHRFQRAAVTVCAHYDVGRADILRLRADHVGDLALGGTAFQNLRMDAVTQKISAAFSAPKSPAASTWSSVTALACWSRGSDPRSASLASCKPFGDQHLALEIDAVAVRRDRQHRPVGLHRDF